jgi:hypothetical protein
MRLPGIAGRRAVTQEVHVHVGRTMASGEIGQGGVQNPHEPRTVRPRRQPHARYGAGAAIFTSGEGLRVTVWPMR